ncbi:MAG TPA: hypothetical protein VF896_10045, partial [Anaerolineales bacterium]
MSIIAARRNMHVAVSRSLAGRDIPFRGGGCNWMTGDGHGMCPTRKGETYARFMEPSRRETDPTHTRATPGCRHSDHREPAGAGHLKHVPTSQPGLGHSRSG